MEVRQRPIGNQMIDNTHKKISAYSCPLLKAKVNFKGSGSLLHDSYDCVAISLRKKDLYSTHPVVTFIKKDAFLLDV